MKALAIAAILLALPHDFFISILTIAHDAERGELKIIWRMTTHDVEHALEPSVGGRKLQLGTPLQLPEADSLLREYVLSHIDLKVDERPVVIQFLGMEVEQDDMYCYLLVENVNEFRSITVHSGLLFDMFDEQENVVHVEAKGGKHTHTFRNHSRPHTFQLP